MHKSIYHVIMRLFKNSIIVNVLHHLVRLHKLEDAFLRLNEEVKRRQLLLHVVYCFLYNFVNSQKFMVVAEACHLWICICVLLKTIFTEGLLMSAAILSYFLVVSCANSVGLCKGGHRELTEVLYRRKNCVMFIIEIHQC